jgi:hypothetical protein
VEVKVYDMRLNIDVVRRDRKGSDEDGRVISPFSKVENFEKG